MAILAKAIFCNFLAVRHLKVTAMNKILIQTKPRIHQPVYSLPLASANG